MIKMKTAVKNATFLGVSCFLAYAGCYMGRNILSTMLPQMIGSNIYGRESLATMGSAFLITYGLGQLVNGFIGNKISAKYMVFVGLFLSGILSMCRNSLRKDSLGGDGLLKSRVKSKFKRRCFVLIHK